MRNKRDILAEAEALMSAGDRLQFLRPNECWSYYRAAALRFREVARRDAHGQPEKVASYAPGLHQPPVP